MSKGSTPRPRTVASAEYAKRHEAIFGKQEPRHGRSGPDEESAYPPLHLPRTARHEGAKDAQRT